MRRKNRLNALLALCTSLATTPSPAMTTIHTEKSLYRNILVYEEDGQRCMSFSQRNQTTRQTCQSLTDPDQFVFTYTRMMMAALYLNPHPRAVLIIGLGGGVLPTALARMFPETRIDIVEIDPAVVKVARQFFGFNPDQRVQVFEEDGRVFVKRAGKSGRHYDLIMLDAFDHEYIPEHLLTQEFLFEIKVLLTADGVLAANTFSTSRLYHHESTTYQAVFGPFYNLRVQMKNRIVLAKMDGLPPLDTIKANATALEEKLKPLGFGSDWLLPLFSTERDWDPNARILTDQYSPSNLLNTLVF
ncbi:MAG TPA: fused MFS/spermidine synthase [Candidatus Competibacter sp.]|nr:fused MFS/spermidine synthase [Candidatus Competibacter sp.]HRX62597.1 fused MFS/spermidine synthase [Candidatus Competibacter sp.]